MKILENSLISVVETCFGARNVSMARSSRRRSINGTWRIVALRAAQRHGLKDDFLSIVMYEINSEIMGFWPFFPQNVYLFFQDLLSRSLSIPRLSGSFVRS